MMIERIVATEADTERLGTALAPRLHAGLVLFLHGELGAGKTTFVRGTNAPAFPSATSAIRWPTCWPPCPPGPRRAPA